MTQSPHQRVESMSVEEKTRKLAEEVMGWYDEGGLWVDDTGCEIGYASITGAFSKVAYWSPLTNPSHDYMVLERVREAWDSSDKGLHADALCRLWKDRDPQTPWETMPSVGAIIGVSMATQLYHPGDYATAALIAHLEEQDDE